LKRHVMLPLVIALLALAFVTPGQRAGAYPTDHPDPRPGGPAIAEWKKVTLPGHPRGGRSVTFSPDGKTLASGGADHVVRLWETGTGKPVAELKGHAGSVWSVAFSPDGKTLVAGSGLLDPGGTKYIGGEMMVWDVTRLAMTATHKDHARVVNHLSFRAGGKNLASAGDDGTVRLWEVEGGKLKGLRMVYDAAAVPARLRKRPPDAVSSAAFSPDGKLLAFDRNDGAVVLWDVDAGREKAAVEAGLGFVRRLAFSPDGKALAAAGDRGIKLWDVASGKESAALTGHKRVVFSVAFSRDGRSLVSGSNDGEVKLWDLARKRGETVLAEENVAVYALALSADGKALAAARGNGSIILWRIAPPKKEPK
jgi:WD40 repeat protein